MGRNLMADRAVLHWCRMLPPIEAHLAAIEAEVTAGDDPGSS